MNITLKVNYCWCFSSPAAARFLRQSSNWWMKGQIICSTYQCKTDLISLQLLPNIWNRRRAWSLKEWLGNAGLRVWRSAVKQGGITQDTLCSHFRFASSPSSILSFGSYKCMFVETSRHEGALKGNCSACEIWLCGKSQIEMCYSVPQTQAGGESADLMVCCSGVFCMRLLACAWEAVIHSTWLIRFSGFSFQYTTREANF